MNENEIGSIVVDRAIHVHRTLGPGLLESVYQKSLSHSLRKKGLSIDEQVRFPIQFEDLHIPKAFRADIVVENLVILELKSVEIVSPIHAKQLLTYLRLSGLKLG